MITKYANVMNFSNLHWILLVTTLHSSESNFEPNMYTIDNYYKGDREAIKIRKWFAKFFGLYFKLHNNPGTFDKNDFNCHKLIQENKHVSKFRDDRAKESQSYLHHQAKDNKIKQVDDYNCGIISIIQFIELFNGEEKFHQLDSGSQSQYLAKIRLGLFLLIRDLYDCLNGKFYDAHENCLNMKVGNWKEVRHLDKYRWTLVLIKEGYYEYEKIKLHTIQYGQ